MGHALRFFGILAIVAMAAAPDTFLPALRASGRWEPEQDLPPQVAPAGREEMYRRAWQFASMTRGGIVRPRWMADRNSFWYADGAPDNTIIYKVDPTTKAKTPVFDTPRLRAELAKVLGHEPPFRGLPFDTFSFLDNERTVKFSLEGQEYVMPLASYAISRLTQPSRQELARGESRLVRDDEFGPAVRESLSPDGRWLLGERDYNLYVRSTYDGREVPLTTDGVEHFEWRIGALDNVRQALAKWAPDSSRVGVLKRDDRNVPEIPVVNYLKQNEEASFTPLTKAGGPLGLTELYVVDILSRTTVKAQLPDDPDRYIAMVGWLADGSELLFQRMNRDFKKLQLMAMDPRSGAVRTILEETQKTFVRGISNVPRWDAGLITLLDGGKRFIYLSERDGWDHLYLYNIDGTLVKRLTSGQFPVLRVVDVDPKGGWVYFTAHGEPRVYDTHVYRVGLDGQGFSRLTDAEGIHDPVFSPSKAFFLDSHSSLSRPRSVDLRTADGRLVQTVATADISALTALNWKAPEEFVVKAADGKRDLHGILFKPLDFDPEKKYPVIDWINAGPASTLVLRTFNNGRNGYAQSLAELGAIVVVLDARGTTDRGKAFQDVVYRNFGRNEVPDHAGGLKQLAAARPYMDMSRVAAVGDGWGGYFVLRALLTMPDAYHVGVAFAPSVTLDDQYGANIEPYMDLPQNNRAGYEYGSNLPLAGNLKGKLLILHGTSDLSPSYSGTMKMAEAFIRAGRFFDLIVMPGMTHEIHGVDYTYLRNAEARYLTRHLLQRQS